MNFIHEDWIVMCWLLIYMDITCYFFISCYKIVNDFRRDNVTINFCFQRNSP